MTSVKDKTLAEQRHILVVDDDARIRELVCRYLSQHDFMPLIAEDAEEAAAVLERFEVDAMVVDVMMPGQTGFEFTASVREAGNDIPVLLLTALGEIDDRLEGFGAGADDYLPKPFDPRELVMRLNALLRRKPKHNGDVKPFRVGRWIYKPGKGFLEDGDEKVKLTSSEESLLQAMAQQAGQVIGREDLAELCGIESGERTIDVQVTRLRKKIEIESKTPQYLLTVRGKGYILHIEDI